MIAVEDDPIKTAYLNTLKSFKKVNEGVFGLKLSPDWKNLLHELKSSLAHLNVVDGLPLTPKLHIVTVHIEEWIVMNGRSLGKESEQPGESLHHLWRRLLEGQGKVKDKESEAFQLHIISCLLKFNADNL